MAENCKVDDCRQREMRSALENAEQFLCLYIGGASSIDDAKHTLEHVREALGQPN